MRIPSRNIVRITLTACLAISLSACASWGELPPTHLLGQQVDDAAATQVVVIHPETRWANIESGQIVRFIVEGKTGNKTFTWAFNNSQEITSFDLNRVTPPGLLDHRVTIYLTRDPKYIRD
ncbi:MAG TPA: CzcE family metal-binding protein [Oxalicibacterium sp.]|nr:CzcE family metal-binding protein [Oxalicibacterium sp.]